MSSKTPAVIINTLINENVAIPSEINNAAIITRRGTFEGTDPLGLLTDLALYTRFQIPGQFLTDPQALLSFFKDTVGAVVNKGVTNTITLVAPDSATVVNVNGQDFTQLVWNSEPEGWSDIVGITISGVAIQGVASGTIFKISTTAFSMLLSGVTGAFTNATPVTLDYTNLSVTLPNGQSTEQFVLDAFYASAALVGNDSTLNVSVTTPQIDLYVMSDRDSLFSPTNAATDLLTVDFVTVNPDSTVLLGWDPAPPNWIYVPETALGNSTIEVAATPTDIGTILEQLGPQANPTGQGVSVLIQPTVGSTFTVGDELTLRLDDTFSIFDRVQQVPYKFVTVDVELIDSDQITSAAGNLFAFTEYLNEVNAATAVQQQQFGTIGIVGAVTLSVQDLLTFGVIDSANYSVPFFPYTQKLGDVFITGGQLAASYTAIVASNEVPFPNMDNFALNGFPVSSDASTYISVGTGQESDTVLDSGLTPIGVNSTSEAFIVRPVTTQLTVPATDEPDEEFFDMHVQQVIRELKGRTFVVSQLPQFQNTFITNTLISDMRTAVEAMLSIAQAEKMILDITGTSFPSIVIVQDTLNPQQLNITYDVKITQALEIQNYNETIVSSITATTITTAVTLAAAA